MSKKYCIIFEPDTDEFTCLNCPAHAEEEPGHTYCAADPHLTYIDDPSKRPEFCSARPLPPRIPQNAYDFENYTNGIAKGNNDVLDQLEGKHGEYDPEVDKV